MKLFDISCPYCYWFAAAWNLDCRADHESRRSLRSSSNHVTKAAAHRDRMSNSLTSTVMVPESACYTVSRITGGTPWSWHSVRNYLTSATSSPCEDTSFDRVRAAWAIRAVRNNGLSMQEALPFLMIKRPRLDYAPWRAQGWNVRTTSWSHSSCGLGSCWSARLLHAVACRFWLYSISICYKTILGVTHSLYFIQYWYIISIPSHCMRKKNDPYQWGELNP